MELTSEKLFLEFDKITMNKCPFCEKSMVPVKPEVALGALGIDMEGTLGGMLKKALSNPKGKVYQCPTPTCRFIAIFGA